MIFIFSLPRSGSTWLGKIFDSHPDVLYLHEPTIGDRGYDLLPRYWLNEPPTREELTNAATYILRLAGNRTLRAVGTLPIFRKKYRHGLAEFARQIIILAAKSADRFGLRLDANGFRVPDFVTGSAPRTTVIKSVSLIGHAECFVRANVEGFLPVFLIRHPCGYIASMLRGQRLGTMELPTAVTDLLVLPAASQLGVKERELYDAPAWQLLAWNWLLQNLEASRALPQAITLRYENLAEDPTGCTKTLFGEAGLSWCRQTEAFLSRRDRRNGPYYSVQRDPRTAASRWRTELDSVQINGIRDIVGRHELGNSYFLSPPARPEPCVLAGAT